MPEKSNTAIEDLLRLPEVAEVVKDHNPALVARQQDQPPICAVFDQPYRP